VLQYHFNLEDAICDGWRDCLELLIQIVRWRDSQPAGDRIFAASIATLGLRGAGGLGWSDDPSQSGDQGFRTRTERACFARISSTYAPELNPVEYLWSYWKQHALPNFCPKNFWQLSYYARKALRRMRKRSTLVTAFWAQAELF
jgi:hypothetical protein